jgi:hypothetical protein
MSKKFFFILIFSTHLFSNCLNTIIKDNSFRIDKVVNSTEYLANGKVIQKQIKTVNNFPSCSVDNQFLFQFEYRDDLQDIFLIQFIFKSNLNPKEFDIFSTNFVMKPEVISSINNISTNKKKIIEIINANKIEISYEYDNNSKKIIKKGIKLRNNQKR